MSRHSKNNTANPVFTYAERQMVKDFGLQKQRIGADSQKQFEHCTLCLSKVIDPMICEQGHLFCRECIIENMIKQKKNNNALFDAYHQKVGLQQMRAEAHLENQRQEHQNQFELLDFNMDILQRKTVKSQTDHNLSGYLTADHKEMLKIKEQLQDKGKIMITNTKEDLTQKNFWIPEGNHFESEILGEAPKKQVLCPASNDHELKIRKLYKVHLFDGGNPKSDEVFCYACSKTLKFQKVAASKKCGHVMCRQCIEKICLPEKKCMQCSKPFEKSDIINLEEAKSAFVSHNSVEASKFTPKMLI